MIRGVILDMGGTILDYGGAGGWRRAWGIACDGVQRVLDEVGIQVLPTDLTATMMKVEDLLWKSALGGNGAPTIAQEIEEAFTLLGLPTTPSLIEQAAAAYGEGLQKSCEVYPDSASTLSALHDSGAKLGLVSNTVVPGSVHIVDLKRFGLFEHFDDLLFSSDARLWKPNPAIFRLAMANLGLSPADCVFVGDRMIDDVWGAQRAGIRGILKYRDLPDQDYAEGKIRGIVPDATIRTLAELPPLLHSLDGRRPARRK